MEIKRQVGRPTKYDKAIVRRLVDAVSVGVGIEDACAFVGIAKDTFYRWKQEHPEFSDEVEKAEASGKVRRLARIDKAGRGGAWQADAWYLERKYPEEFGRKMIIQVSAEQAAILKAINKTATEVWTLIMQQLAMDYYAEQLTIDTHAVDTE